MCCTGICGQGGVCEEVQIVCGSVGDPCAEIGGAGTEVFPCCEKGLLCIEGTCQPDEPPCIALGESCELDIEGFLACCDKGAICIDGICQFPATCAGLGESCSNLDGVAGDCCDDLVCVDGTCEVIADTCLDPGGACEVDDDCCTGICCGGTCADIECCID
ncbi:MAG: hypothetical protein M3Y37_06965, partial [Chloroflexota bacterium]|nr:hypothetical protein [Chloroflexota bacterium]